MWIRTNLAWRNCKRHHGLQIARHLRKPKVAVLSAVSNTELRLSPLLLAELDAQEERHPLGRRNCLFANILALKKEK